jgi:V8-like Glu-specific endopeptidase
MLEFMKRFYKFAVLMTVLGLLLSIVSSGQPAAAATGSTDQFTVNRPVASGALPLSPLHVWTRDEMLKAIPYPEPAAATAPDAPQDLPKPHGPVTAVPGGSPATSNALNPFPALAAPLNHAGTEQPTYSYPFPYFEGEVSASNTNQYPYITVGKVFFLQDGVAYVCSGSSAAGRGIWTAGHCVFNPTTHRWHTNWVFVPAYRDGTAPFGQWTAQELWTTGGWYYNGKLAYDIGMAVLYRDVYGRKISQVVGWLGYMANYSRAQYFTALGYPAQYPFSGGRMTGCTAPHAIDDWQGADPATMGIGCDMNGGSSGGPWVVDFGWGGGNWVNSVNSYKYTGWPGAMFGPYFGDAAINLYNTVTPR